MIKAMFFDVDRTLFSHQTRCVSPAVLDTLHQLHQQDIKLFLSTGRHPMMLKEIRSLFPFDGSITLSGQHVTCGNTLLHSVTLAPESVQELVDATRLGNFPVLFLEGQDLYVNQVNEAVHVFWDTLGMPIPPIRPLDYVLGHPLYQAVAFLSEDQEYLLRDNAPHLTLSRWHPQFLDVLPTGGGKDRGIDAMLEHFGLTPDEAMAFGDGANDISMLRHVKIGVAMGNASDKVKASADYVTSSVEEDGIVHALEHFGFL